MGNYAVDYTAIQPRLGGRTLTLAAANPPSSVTQEMVAAWITEVEAFIDGHLKSIGLTTPVTDTNGKLILKQYVVSKVALRTIRAWELGTRLDEGPSVGADEDKEWDLFMALIQSEPGRVALMMGQGFGTGIQRGQIRAYSTDNPDGVSIANGDLDPTFKRKMQW